MTRGYSNLHEWTNPMNRPLLSRSDAHNPFGKKGMHQLRGANPSGWVQSTSHSTSLKSFVHQLLSPGPVPTLTSPLLVRSQLGIAAAHLFRAAPILERCPGMVIPDKFKFAAL